MVHALDTVLSYFSLPGEKTLSKSDIAFDVVVVDTTKRLAARLGKSANTTKARRSVTQRPQDVAAPKTKRISAVCFNEGKKHDFNLLQEAVCRFCRRPNTSRDESMPF